MLKQEQWLTGLTTLVLTVPSLPLAMNLVAQKGQNTAKEQEISGVIENVCPDAVLGSAHVSCKQKSEDKSSDYADDLGCKNYESAVSEPDLVCYSNLIFLLIFGLHCFLFCIDVSH